MEMEPAVAQQPSVDGRGLVGAQVVQDDVHVELGGHLAVDLVQKGDEVGLVWDLRMSVMTVPRGHVEGGEQVTVPLRS